MDAMTKVRESNRSRVASTALAAVLMLFLAGDRAAYTTINGIDPLDVLDLAVKNNVLFVVDTSSSMSGLTISGQSKDVGGDDLAGRFYQTKRAVREVVKANASLVNFGLGSFHPKFIEHEIAATATGEGPLYYVSQDAAAANWMAFFNNPSSTYADYDGATSAEIFRSFDSSTRGFNTPYPPACTVAAVGAAHVFGTNCRYYMRSFRLRNGVQYTWKKTLGAAGLQATGTITCPLPPRGLVGDDTEASNGSGPDGIVDTADDTPVKPRGCFEIKDSQGSAIARYFYSSATFKFANVPETNVPIVSSDAATNQVFAPGHGLVSSDEVAISGHVGSVPSLVGTWTVTVIDSSHFTINGMDITRNGTGGTLLVQNDTDSTSCGQTGLALQMAPCTQDNSQAVQDLMRLELQVDPVTGLPIDVSANSSLNKIKPYNPPGSGSFAMTGIRQGNGTPLGASLQWAKTYYEGFVFPAQAPALVGVQKHYVILLTDGYESCGGNASAAALALWNLSPRVETFVVAFVGGTGAAANAIARAGSGGVRDAYSVTTLPDLINALNDAIQLAAGSATYSAQPSITESVYELGSVLATPVNPLDPRTRYNANVPVRFPSTFVMPGFKGHLKAFRNASGTSLEVWDAGQKLLDRVKNTMEAGCIGRTVNGVSHKACTFAELLNGATEATVATSRIPRRIYTTTGNNLAAVTPTELIARTANVTASNTTAYRVPLWPPTTASSGGISPNDTNNSSGILDGALGLLNLTEAQLKAQFQACEGSNLPPGCADSNAAKRLAEQRREARERMLAFLAGAETIPDAALKPARDVTAKRLLFKARPWILAESTLSTPSVVTPPLESKPSIHVDEYTLFRDGPRNTSNQATNGILQGFGLRNPDNDATSASNMALKPAMTVVYHGANDGLHAFRAAPCPSSTLVCAGETGGEELWAFVPYDQLGKLAGLMQPQLRKTKTYVIASPVRFQDVWVPGTFSMTIGGANVAGDGVWRTLLYFGRGIAGKYYTALDVTVPGPFTRHSVNGDGTNGGDKYAPLPVWSRGNPDTSDGQLKGASNVFNNPTSASAGQADYDAYLRMGETWSVPAIGKVTASENTTARTAGGVEFVAYVGSGYGAPGEGTTFYALDALTGDVIAKTDVDLATTPPATPIFTPNALVASPAVYSPNPLKYLYMGNPAGEKATRVYIGDVYGRFWKFLPSTANTGFPAILMQDFGVQQTIGAAAALLTLDYDGTMKPYVFLETGRDRRVTPPPAATPPFKILGLRDDASDTDITTPQTPYELFPRSDPGAPGIDFPGPPDPANFRFRGTSQPATAFNEEGKGRVFFVGTQFNPVNVACISSFDSILFALTAGTGAAAYDLGLSPGVGAAYTTFTGEKVTGVQVVGGQLALDQGINVGSAPPPPAPPQQLPPAPGTQGDVFVGSTLPASTAYRVGSVVCQP
jgi:hypothetical protein